MSRTVTALYDTRSEAEAARQRLGTGVDIGSARIIDHPKALDDIHMSGDDRHVYAEGIRRGAFVLTAEVRGHEDPDRIIRILEESASLDLDSRQELWLRDGWSLPPSAQPGTASGGSSFPGGTLETGRGGSRVRSYLRDAAPGGHDTGGYSPAALGVEQHGHHAPGPCMPSRTVVVSSAVVGAVAGGIIGGVLPFLLTDEFLADSNRERRPRQSGPVTVPVGDDGRVRVIRS